jgi:outer membrane protein TolC
MQTTAFKSICTVLCLILAQPVVRADSISVRFDQLEEFALSKSSAAQIYDLELESFIAERDKELQWSNPELAYDREDIDIADEYQITINKRFAVPWATMKKRSGWDGRIHSADLQRRQLGNELLSEIKIGYVRIQLLDAYLLRLGQLKEIITDASHVATSHHTEGHLSGVEDHLIQMTVISIQAGYQSALQERRMAESHFRAIMGFKPEDSLRLTTEITYLPVTLSSKKDYLKRLESQPGYQGQLKLSESFGKLAASERGKFIPAIELYGGYKKVNPDFEGYVAGVSLSLPLFNVNGAAARQYDIRKRLVESKAEIYRTEMYGQIGSLIESIKGLQHTLGIVADHFDEDLETLNNLLYSYEEGWMTLSELLNAIQIEVTGLKDYYDQLTQYYDNIFGLEAIIAENLVSFTE